MTARHVIAVLSFLVLAVAPGCGKESPAPSGGAAQAQKSGSAAGSGGGQDVPGHGGKVIELGSATIGPFGVRASRDEGRIQAGGDAPIDVWLTGSDAEVVAVRFWIGAESAAGSVKAKADIEDLAQPNHWHTHAEVPSPLPAGSRLWVEIEIRGQGKKAGSFDLKG